MTGTVLDGAAEAGAKLVFADNLYVYGPPDEPMTEETPQRARGKKGRTRIQMADAVLGAHADGRLRATIGRSSDYYGPRGTTSTVGENIMRPALHGKRVRWLGSLDQPHTLNYVEDMGRGLVTLGERNEADGQVWHLPAAEPLTGRQFLELLFEQARKPPKIGVASRPMIRIGGLFNPLLRELNETLYQFERPFVSDASKFQAPPSGRSSRPAPGGGDPHGRLVPPPVRRLTPGPSTRGTTGLRRVGSGAAQTTRAAPSTPVEPAAPGEQVESREAIGADAREPGSLIVPSERLKRPFPRRSFARSESSQQSCNRTRSCGGGPCRDDRGSTPFRPKRSSGVSVNLLGRESR
jgi:hypothetical protein